MIELSERDCAWLAGLLEGEGCFKLHNKTNGYRGTIAIALQMSDEDVVQRAAFLMGCKVMGPHGPYGVSKKQTWQVIVMGKKAEGLMRQLLPFMGKRRSEKIAALLAHREAGQVVDPERRPSCHPERKYSAKGMCSSCYMKGYHARAATGH